MHIFIRFDGGQTSSVNIDDNATCRAVFDSVAQTLGLQNAEEISLNVGGRPMPFSNDVLVSEIEELRDVASLDVAVRLIGGKVHGSLARAGKVKAQTPKVAKAEGKKKKRTGRAKRRQQYNRRFVNVVAGLGRRRGPNANVPAP